MYDYYMELPGISPAVVQMVMRELGRKGGLKRNPRKGFGSGGASQAARKRWDRYRQLQKQGKVL